MGGTIKKNTETMIHIKISKSTTQTKIKTTLQDVRKIKTKP